MQFLILCKADDASEAGHAPAPAERAALDDFHARLRAAGVLRLAGELLPSAHGARLKFADGSWSVRRGPFADPHELVAAFVMIDVASRDEAMAWGRRWPGAGEREIELREAGCSSGCVGFDTTPSAPDRGRQRYVVLLKSDAEAEADIHPAPAVIENMMRHNAEGVRAGIVLAGEGLQPTSKGARIKFARGGHAITDGPFTEAKELIAGFWLIEAGSLDEALVWAKGYPYPRTGAIDVEVRQLPGGVA